MSLLDFAHTHASALRRARWCRGEAFARFMQIERVECTPRREMYNPGDVLNVAVRFRDGFIGQCEAGLVLRNGSLPEDFRRNVLARSNDRLYEGQVQVREDQVGSCILVLRLTPVKGTPTTVAAGEQIIEVRPVRP